MSWFFCGDHSPQGQHCYPWQLLRRQDAMSRHRTFSTLSHGADYIFTLLPIVGRMTIIWFLRRGRRVGLVVRPSPFGSVVTGSYRSLYRMHGTMNG